MTFTPRVHTCRQNTEYTIETAMHGVDERWSVFKEDEELGLDIVYEINYCPFCGVELIQKDRNVLIQNDGRGSFRMVP